MLSKLASALLLPLEHGRLTILRVLDLALRALGAHDDPLSS